MAKAEPQTRFRPASRLGARKAEVLLTRQQDLRGDKRGIEPNQCARQKLAEKCRMAKLIFRCTRTGMNVQIQMPDAAPTDHSDSYESVKCPACAGIHLINKTTGKLLGDNENRLSGDKKR
jgi:hypothetical protein